jgi:hypothetical protein
VEDGSGLQAGRREEEEVGEGGPEDLTPEAARRVEELLEGREKGWEEELERILGKEKSRRLLEGLGRW